MEEKIKLFVSQPMAGLSDEEILLDRERCRKKFILENSYDETNVKVIDNTQFGIEYSSPLEYLANDICAMAEADVVMFAKGWETRKGCMVEFIIAREYGIKMCFESNNEGANPEIKEDNDMTEFIKYIKDANPDGIVITAYGKYYDALFFNNRVYKSILPEGYYCYDIREGDNGEACELAKNILVNHFGSIITKVKIDFQEQDSIIFNNDTNYYSFSDEALDSFKDILE